MKQANNCEECKLKDECMVLYPCELNNKLVETKTELDNYKTAWDKLKTFVENLQEGHENTYAYSNEYIDDIEAEIERLEQKLKL